MERWCGVRSAVCDCGQQQTKQNVKVVCSCHTRWKTKHCMQLSRDYGTCDVNLIVQGILGCRDSG